MGTRRRRMTAEERRKGLEAMREWRAQIAELHTAIETMAVLLIGDGMSLGELEAALDAMDRPTTVN